MVGRAQQRDVTRLQRHGLGNAEGESQAPPSPAPKPGQRTAGPSSLKLLSSRVISSVNSLPTHRHSKCPYKTDSARFSAPRIHSALSSSTPRGNSRCAASSGFGWERQAGPERLQRQADTTCGDLVGRAPEDKPFSHSSFQPPLPLASSLAFPWEIL